MSATRTLDSFLQHHDLFVVENSDIGLTLKGGERLKPCRYLKEDQYESHGNDLRQRAVEMRGNRSLADGFYLLANQEEVLGEFPEFIYLLLPGTQLRGPDGLDYMARLFYDGDRWDITCLPFDRKYDKDDYFVCNDE